MIDVVGWQELEGTLGSKSKKTDIAPISVFFLTPNAVPSC